jgi:hypothetical protein
LARLETQRAQGDEDKDIEQGRCLKNEGGRLFVLQMEAPGQPHEQGHIDQDGEHEEPARQARPRGGGEPTEAEKQITAQRPRRGLEPGTRDKGLWRDGVERPESHDDGELNSADQDFAAVFLVPDGRAHPFRQTRRFGQAR